MYVNQLMLNDPTSYTNNTNKELMDTAIRIHKLYSDNEWWYTKTNPTCLTTFTPKFRVTVSRTGVFIEPLPEPTSYGYTVINGKTYIEHNGWWMPAKLFIDLVDEDGKLHGEAVYVRLPEIIAGLQWLSDTDCTFRLNDGVLEFWYLESDFPFKKVISRALQEVKTKKFFKEKYNAKIECRHNTFIPGIHTEIYIYRF